MQNNFVPLLCLSSMLSFTLLSSPFLCVSSTHLLFICLSYPVSLSLSLYFYFFRVCFCVSLPLSYISFLHFFRFVVPILSISPCLPFSCCGYPLFSLHPSMLKKNTATDVYLRLWNTSSTASLANRSTWMSVRRKNQQKQCIKSRSPWENWRLSNVCLIDSVAPATFQKLLCQNCHSTLR